MKSEKQKPNRRTPRTAWKPGQSGNPNGRPPSEKALATALREIVNPRELAQKLYDMALGEGMGEEPSLPAIKLIFERLEGLPVASVALDANVNPRLEILAELKRIGFQDPGPMTEAANDA
ncbi:MAG: hypothetical protein MdMp014T_1618 [Treponematales bacterium]